MNITECVSLQGVGGAKRIARLHPKEGEVRSRAEEAQMMSRNGLRDINILMRL